MSSGDSGEIFLQLHQSLLLALRKKSLTNIRPIQNYAMPLIYHRKDVLVRAAAGTGKKHAYLIPILDDHFSIEGPHFVNAAEVIIISPTHKSCQDLHELLLSLTEYMPWEPEVAVLTSDTYCDALVEELNAESPEFVISTPEIFKSCLEKKHIGVADHAILVLDEMDQLLVHGYEADLKCIMDNVPESLQCLVFTSDRCYDAKGLNSIVKRNPYILTLQDDGVVKVEIIPYNAEQIYIICNADHGKFLRVREILDVRCKHKNVLIFTNSTVTSQMLQIFIGRFSYSSRHAVLDDDLSHKSCLSIEDGDTFDCLIVTDDGLLKQKTIDFKNFYAVINFDVPRTVDNYTLRTDRTRTAENIGISFFLLRPEEKHGIFKKFKTVIGGDYVGRSEIILPDIVSSRWNKFPSWEIEGVKEFLKSQNWDEERVSSSASVGG